MRPRSVLVLLVVAVALLTFIWVYEGELPSSDERAKLGKRLLRVERDEITSVEIIRGDERVQLEQVAVGEEDAAGVSEWQIVEPLVARADEEQVEALVGALTTLEKRRALDDVTDADVGLDAPRARVRLVGAESESEILIGTEIPAANSMIVALVGSDAKYVVDDSVWSALDQTPGEWRSKSVFPGELDDIDRVTLSHGEQQLLLAKRTDGFWLESPVTDHADADQVQDLLADLTGMQVAEFVDQRAMSLGEYGVEPPVGEVEIVMTGRPEPFRLFWGNGVAEQEGRTYASAEDQLFVTESDLIDSLSRPIDEWRSRAITSLETYQIDWVNVIQPGSDDLRLERAGADWRRNEEEISFTSVSDFLYAVTDTNAQLLSTPEDLQSRGLELGEPTVELTLGGGDREETVSLYAAASEGVPVTVHNRQVILWVEAKTIDEILAKLADVRAAESKNTAQEDEQDTSGAELSTDQDS